MTSIGARPAGLLVMVLCGTAVLVSACGEAPAPAPARADVIEAPAPLEGPPPVPLPQLGGFDLDVQQQLRDAHAALQAAIDAGTATGDEYGRLGMQFAGYGLVEEAEAAYLNARVLAPAEFRWAYYLGVLYDTTSRPEEAIPALERALELGPGYLAGMARLGDLLAGQDRVGEATRRYRDALALDPSCIPCLVGLGQMALQDRDYAAAVAHLEQALELAPGAATIRYPLALAYRGLGEDGKAQEQLDARAEATRNTGMGRQIDRAGVFDPLVQELEATAVAGNVAIEARGVMAARDGRWAEAIAEFKTLVAADPENAVSRNLLALALMTTGDREGARYQYQETVRLEPSHARANLQLGLLHVDDGQEQAAIARFRAAVEADPGANMAYLNLAGALLRNGEAAEAADVYEALLELDPSNAPARLGRAFSLIRAGRHVEAKARLTEDILARPTEVAFPHALARLLAASPDATVRDGNRAATLIQQVSQTVRNGQVAETTAMVLAEAGVFDSAVQSQGIAIRLADEAGMTALAADLRATLAQYAARHPSRVPFRSNDPVFFPAPFRPSTAFDDEPR
jgi:tetratricopeptide (TPR) repeat protein